MSQPYTFFIKIDADTFDSDDLLENLICEGIAKTNASTGHTIYSVEAQAISEEELSTNVGVVLLKFKE